MVMKYWGFILFLQYSILLVATETETDPLPAPLNFTLTWTNEFCVSVTWTEPKDLGTCEVEYQFTTNISQRIEPVIREVMFYNMCVTTKEAVHFTVQTNPVDSYCGKRTKSKPVTITIPRSKDIELVTDFHCSLYSSKAMNCSWLPANQPQELQLYYWVKGRPHVTACSEYLYRGGVKTGCHLSEDGFLARNVFFLINGTLNGSSVRNKFWRIPIVNPPPPKMMITKRRRSLLMSWTAPDLTHENCWNYTLNYSKCKESVSQNIAGGKKNESVEIPYDPSCQYRVQVKANYQCPGGRGGTDWSAVKSYGEDEAPDWSMTVVAVVIPATIAFSVMLSLIWFRKYKIMLFPMIPDPSLIFKDMIKNNKEQKSSVGKLYVPVQEEVVYKISLEKDPLHPLPDF